MKDKVKEVTDKLDGSYNLYDPPDGWRYGFPKRYSPQTPDEDIVVTLVRDGYPEDMAKTLGNYTRFIGPIIPNKK